MKIKKGLSGIFIVLCCIQTIHSKRATPETIEPVRIGKYVYSIPHFTAHNTGGVLREEDTETHKIFDYVLYKVRKKPFLEGDVQDVFFKSMEYLEKEHVLKLIDEKNRIYLFDLKLKRVKRFKGLI